MSTPRHLYRIAKRAIEAREAYVAAIVESNAGMKAKPDSTLGARYRGLAEQHLYNERASRKAERYQRASAAKSVSVVVSEGWNSKPGTATKEGKKKR